MIRYLAVLLLFLLATPPASLAQDAFRQGLQALEQGEYAQGYALVAPLALQGDARCQFLVGLLYERGLHLPKDAAAAGKWYELAARQGHTGAMNNLGLLLKNGRGGPRNLEEAYAWLARAAVAGNDKAADNRDIVAQDLAPADVKRARRLALEWRPTPWDAMRVQPPPLPDLPLSMEPTPAGDTQSPPDTGGAHEDAASVAEYSQHSEDMDKSVLAPQRSTDDGAPAAAYADTLRGLIPHDPPHADPQHSTGDFLFARNLYVRLLENKAGASGGSSPQPGLAASWDVSADGKTYTFRLREDMRFHDGTAITADDVAFTYQRLLDPRMESPGSGLLAFVAGASDRLRGRVGTARGIEVVAPHTLRITLEKPWTPFLAALAHPWASILSRSFTEPLGKNYGTSAQTTLGSGPWRLDAWDKGRSIHLVAVGETPPSHPREVLLRVESDPETAREEYVAGSVDWLDAASYPDLRPWLLKRGAPGLLVREPQSELYFLAVNNARPPFDTLLVRKALQLAVRRRDILPLFDGAARMVNGVLPPAIRCYAPMPATLTRNVEMARELLAQAGYPEGVTLRLASVQERGEPFAAMERAIRDSAAAAGFGVELVPMDLPAFLALMERGELDAYVGRWDAAINDPDAFFHAYFSRRGTVVRSIRYSNAPMQLRVERAATAKENDTRCAMYHELGRIIAQQDAAWLPLAAPLRVLRLGNRVAALPLPWNGQGAPRFCLCVMAKTQNTSTAR